MFEYTFMFFETAACLGQNAPAMRRKSQERDDQNKARIRCLDEAKKRNEPSAQRQEHFAGGESNINKAKFDKVVVTHTAVI